ncbi:hypothetical protein OIU78_020858 [Salix suchowensis]|nr:hypothetical protein OIU78_020858 [Salix suchowensis]
MYEYSLPSLFEVTVLCQLRRKGDSKSRPQKDKKAERRQQEPPAKDPESGEGGILVMQQTPRLRRPGLVIIKAMTSGEITAPAESSKYGIVYNGVRFDNLESFSHAFL